MKDHSYVNRELENYRASLGQQGSVAMVMQGYALSVQKQPPIPRYPTNKDIDALGKRANTHLLKAQANAANYLDRTQRMIIVTLDDMEHYFKSQLEFGKVLSSTMANTEAIKVLDLLAHKLDGYIDAAKDVVVEVTQVRDAFSQDQRAFRSVAYDATVLKEAQQGVLTELQLQLEEAEKQLQAMHRKRILGIFAIVSGAIVIALGSLLTAGAATPLVISGGMAMIGKGVDATAGGITGYREAMRHKSNVLGHIHQTESGILLLSNMSASMVAIADEAGSAVDASQAMLNGWTLLQGSLAELKNDMAAGKQYVDVLREAIIAQARGGISTIENDIKTLRAQMSGAKIVAPSGQTLEQAMETALAA
ncbi:HBL/NHE enterotoxin family protein [Pseudomonas typographi]|uniref:HBL/NHE enterotoxin family protein n=1 Tax=Pseudomonas typographi TaxID=2715964 RepID=UPI001682CFEA|nr:HBL/NHE enterotoxin family protein [Pseudomonas typographi]MBD1587083.1 alpha-helical pore-forming toxin family protein [Pseudomonas typographi]